jgi:hypothetical protein
MYSRTAVAETLLSGAANERNGEESAVASAASAGR